MGLLGNFNFDDPETMGLLSAGLNMLSNSGRGSNMSTGQIIAGGAGAGMQGAQNVLQARAMQEIARRKAEHDDMQLKTNQQEYDMRSGQMQDKERGRLEQIRIAQLLAGARNSGSPLDYQSLAMQGVPVQTLKDMADSGNIGMQEVARTVETTGEGGAKIIQGMDKFGRRVGQGEQGYIAPVSVNLGNRTSFVTPTSGLSLEMGRSPDSVASTAVSMRGQDMADARSKEQATISMSKPFEVTGPDGLPVLVQQDKQGNIKPVTGYSAKVVDKPLNDSQSKALLFGERMNQSNKILSDLGKEGTTSSVPGSKAPVIGGIISALSSDNQQMLDQSKRDFLNAVLRRESGAAISPGEFDSGDKQYFPQIGDSQKVLDQKAKNRDLAVRGVLIEVPEKQRNSLSTTPEKVKTISMQDIVDTAKASGKSTAEVTAAAKAKGYKIGGM
jgi:hypothetical protein